MRVRAASYPQAKSRVMRRGPRHSVEFKMMVVREIQTFTLYYCIGEHEHNILSERT